MMLIAKATPEAVNNEDLFRNEVHKTEWVMVLKGAQTPEQQAIVECLNLEKANSIVYALVLGDLVPSQISRLGLVRPVYYDHRPTEDEIWQRLAVMAGQMANATSSEVMAF